MNLIERELNESMWLMLPFFLFLILFALENQKTSKFYYYSIKGAFNFQFFKLVFKNEESNPKISLAVVSSLSLIGLFIKTTNSVTELSDQHIIVDCFIIIFIISTYYFVKVLLIKISGYLFDKKNLFNVYLIYYKYYIRTIGIFTIPFIALNIIYSSNIEFYFYCNVIFCVLIFCLYISRIYHLVLQGIENKLSYYNIFMYICTLEISPMILLYVSLV